MLPHDTVLKDLIGALETRFDAGCTATRAALQADLEALVARHDSGNAAQPGLARDAARGRSEAACEDGFDNLPV